jgi:hypothetical protein
MLAAMGREKKEDWGIAFSYSRDKREEKRRGGS